MMNTALEKIGDSYLLVNTEGSPVPQKDSEIYKLVIIPKMYIPKDSIQGVIDCSQVSLLSALMIAKETSIDILPDGTKVRQPLPNNQYYIAGTSDRKIGWEIDAPDVDELQLEFCWDVVGVLGCLPCRVVHKINIKLEKTIAGHVFSLDETDFVLSKNPRATSFINPENETEFFHKGNPSQFKVRKCQEKSFLLEITQNIVLSSKSYSDLMTDALEEIELLRDQLHTTTFSSCVDEFNDIISFELPASVLLKAIMVAKKDKSTYVEHKNYCDHPAFNVVRSYIKDYKPNAKLTDFAYLDLFVRVSDDDELWSADLEHPNLSITDFKSSNYCLAGCQGVVLCIFEQERDNGKMSFDWADYAALESLRDFPYNFPSAYELLVKMHNANHSCA
jgi:hypothetical protein